MIFGEVREARGAIHLLMISRDWAFTAVGVSGWLGEIRFIVGDEGNGCHSLCQIRIAGQFSNFLSHLSILNITPAPHR
jgi:hypothetical protein